MRPNKLFLSARANVHRRTILTMSCCAGVLLASLLWALPRWASPHRVSKRPDIDPRQALAELRRLGARRAFLTDSPDAYLEPKSLHRFFTERIYRKLQGNAYFGYDFDEGFVLKGNQVQIEVHVGYETVQPAKLKRIDISDAEDRKSGVGPRALLRADKEGSRILIDSETTLSGIPPEAWKYQLGNRTALEWVLDQYRERKPKDPTIREKFDTYRFADYKEKVIDLLARVTTVSVCTVAIVDAMRKAIR
jgi:Type ISP C-terminal specificity domain